MEILEYLNSWFRGAMVDGWLWVRSLDHHQWFVFLGITSAIGFLGMRGFGSRSTY